MLSKIRKPVSDFRRTLMIHDIIAPTSPEEVVDTYRHICIRTLRKKPAIASKARLYNTITLYLEFVEDFLPGLAKVKDVVSCLPRLFDQVSHDEAKKISNSILRHMRLVHEYDRLICGLGADVLNALRGFDTRGTRDLPSNSLHHDSISVIGSSVQSLSEGYWDLDLFITFGVKRSNPLKLLKGSTDKMCELIMRKKLVIPTEDAKHLVNMWTLLGGDRAKITSFAEKMGMSSESLEPILRDRGCAFHGLAFKSIFQLSLTRKRLRGGMLKLRRLQGSIIERELLPVAPAPAPQRPCLLSQLIRMVRFTYQKR
ncbi:hypothetical protein BOTBODRAFT_444147 [Botryobasidium botryosum FD-172 SS1]|uniref:Uncharacterized protein n=1 Tax=Botryobasidium botryosum (strain FD-172 SS1) TaxID=930990 RepID=A0A067MY37_BOTB1|nr:hypothetical protein BOTBODRAFT_444147 [Botryobasidium botryosum FD-172 SS1]